MQHNLIQMVSKTLRAKADLSADAQTLSIEIPWLPPGIDPVKLVTFSLKTGTPTGTSPTLNVDVESSPDGKTWFKDKEDVISQLTAAGNATFAPTKPARFYRIDLDIGGTTPVFPDTEVHVTYPIVGVSAMPSA